MREPAGGRQVARRERVLDRDGHAAERRPLGHRVDLAGPRTGALGVVGQEAAPAVVLDARERRLDEVGRRGVAGAERGEALLGRQFVRLRSRLELHDREAALHDLGRLAERLVHRQARPRDVVAHHVLERQDVRRGRHVVEVEALDHVHVLEDARQLGLHRLRLVGLQVEARETGHVPDGCVVDHRRHVSGAPPDGPAARG